MADVQSTTAASRRSTKTSSTSSTNMSNNDTVAAMRHLRSIVQSIATDENISPTQRTQKIQNFEQLLDKAEKQLHYKKGAGVCELLDDPLNIKTSKQVVNAEVLKNKNNKSNKKKKNKEWKKKGWLKAGRLLGRQRAANKSMSSSGVGGGSVKLSTTYEGLEVDTRHETEVQRRDMALLQNDDAETREETDSIIDIRDQNSYDYTASIESLRSLNTFEKDFINNVTAEHARMEAAAEDGNSVGTFEQDFVGPVRNNNNVYPTQVEQHQMYNDDAISETTFEADARSLEPLENQAAVGNGGQGGGGSVFVPRMVQTTEHEEVEDDITVGTLGNDEPPQPQHQPNPVLNAWGSAPTTLTTFNNMVKTAFSADNSSSILSVSTFEKDTKAIQALAAKIGRTPSFKPKKSAIPEELESVASDGTFEQDQKKRMRSQISPRMTHQQDGMVMNNASEVSTSTFEKDMNIHQPKPHLSVIGEAASSRLGQSVSRQQSTAGGNMGGGGVQTNNVGSPQMMMHQAPVMHRPSHANAQVRPKENSTRGWFGSSTSRGHENQQDTGVISVHTPVTSKSNATAPSPYTQIMNNRGKQETAATETKAKLTKISPLAVELSPSTVDKGVRKKKAQSSGSLWDRFVCGI